VTSEVFSEYDGDTIYNDFTAVGSDVTILRSYQPGIARVDDPLGSPVTSYYHADKLGTTRGMTTAPLSLIDTSVYTAFGELVDGTNHRYGYIGSEGYQAHDRFPLLHLGARYYEPGIGRFVQRDPIGIEGGSNVYVYAANSPSIGVDPDGLDHWESDGLWPRNPDQIPNVPSPRATQKGLQVVAGCGAVAISLGGWPITGAVIAITLIIIDVGETTGIILPAADSWPTPPHAVPEEFPESGRKTGNSGGRLREGGWPICPY